MTGRKELRAQLVELGHRQERLQQSLVQLQKAKTQTQHQADQIAHQPQMSNQQLLSAAATPRQKTVELQSQIQEMQRLIAACQEQREQIKKKLLGPQ